MKILAAHANRQIRGRYWNPVVQLLTLITTLLFSGTVKRICLMNKDTITYLTLRVSVANRNTLS